MALVLTSAAHQAAEFVGWPEARLPIAEAAIYIATANKSNTSILAIDAALEDVRADAHCPCRNICGDAHYKARSNWAMAMATSIRTMRRDTLRRRILRRIQALLRAD